MKKKWSDIGNDVDEFLYKNSITKTKAAQTIGVSYGYFFKKLRYGNFHIKDIQKIFAIADKKFSLN